MRVLVAEDDPGLRRILQEGLTEEGFVVDVARDGAVAQTLLRHNDYAAAIIDWRMPDLSGLALIEATRAEGNATPFLMLTARDATEDRVAGLNAGADDYLTKPFSFAELVARVRALQRRPALAHQNVLQCADVTMNTETHDATVAGEPVAFTVTEFQLLEVLVRRSPATVPRSVFASHVWEEQSDAFSSNTMEVHMARLRAKLTKSACKIETVRGVGYRLVAP